MKKKMLKKSEVLREGYVQGLKKAQSIITKMLKEDFDDDVVYRTGEEWGKIQQDIGYAVADELAEREYDDYYDLEDSGQLDEIIENVKTKIREQYGLSWEEDITEDIYDHIKHQTGL